MLVCGKCGASNPLGRVFCGSCGSKLDLSNMTSSTVMSIQQSNRVFRHWGKLVAFLIVALLIVCVLSLLPQTKPIGERGSASDAIRVSTPLRSLRALREGRVLDATFAERDINAYFYHVKGRKLKYSSFSVAVGEGYVAVRVVRSLDPIEIRSFKITPAVSFDYTFVPVGSTLNVKRVAIGRLRLPGPLKAPAVKDLYDELSAQPEWDAFKHITAITTEADDRIRVSVQK